MIRILALISFASSGFAETKSLKVAGSCPRQEIESEKKCIDSDGDDYIGHFTIYKFEPKPSTSVKTIGKTCSGKLIEAALKLPEHDVSTLTSQPDDIKDIKFKIQSCTLLENSKTTPQLAILVSEQTPTGNKDRDQNDYGKITFVKVDNKDTPQKVIKVIHSRFIGSPEPNKGRPERYEIKNICDIDEDGRADVLLWYSDYSTAKYKTAIISKDFEEVTIDSWLNNQNCDHSGD